MRSVLLTMAALCFGHHWCDSDERRRYEQRVNENILWEEVRYAHHLDMMMQITKLTTLFKHQSTMTDGDLIPYIPTLEEMQYVLKKPLKRKLQAINYTIEMNHKQIEFVEKYYGDQVDYWPLCIKLHVVSRVFRNKTNDEVRSLSSWCLCYQNTCYILKVMLPELFFSLSTYMYLTLLVLYLPINFLILIYYLRFQRHAMVHEALRDEMLKREAGCAIDIHVSKYIYTQQVEVGSDSIIDIIIINLGT